MQGGEKMAAVINTPYVEVNIWLAKDKEGYTTTSSEGGRLEKENPRGGARCGHASMQMYSEGKAQVYASLWPSELVESFEEDRRKEGTLPDVIIHLHKLNIENMIRVFNTAKGRIDKGEVHWSLKTKETVDLTLPENKSACCATFVYFLLKKGGLETLYKSHLSARGPQNAGLYQLTKCNAGDLLGGIFNGAPWTSWIFTPKALLLRVASAVEASLGDEILTTAIMKSSRVATEKEREGGWEKTAVAITALGTAGVFAYALKKS